MHAGDLLCLPQPSSEVASQPTTSPGHSFLTLTASSSLTLFLPLGTVAAVMSPLICKKAGAPYFKSPPMPRNHKQAVLDCTDTTLTESLSRASPPWKRQNDPVETPSTCTTDIGRTMTKNLAAATTSPIPPQSFLNYFFPMLQTEFSHPCHTQLPNHNVLPDPLPLPATVCNALAGGGLGVPALPLHSYPLPPLPLNAW